MALNFKEEELQSNVRAKLNAEKVKLWLPPHTTEQGGRGDAPEDLIARYSQDLRQPAEAVSAAIEALRIHAVEKLAARNKFQSSGVATLKVKLAGHVPSNANLPRGHNMMFELQLGTTGQELKAKMSELSGIDLHLLKVICSGHVIEDDKTLLEQNIKNCSQMMAVCLSQTEAQARLQEQQVSSVAKTRHAAELLSAKDDSSHEDMPDYYLQIADQNGKIIDLPKEERKALALAMTLHEKGKAALRKKHYGEALLLYLEADKEFKQCRSSILEAVDNYAILCLDIVWCHLCLKNIDQLPDAETRLQTCDDCFRKSYGPNLERLALVRGGTGMERALFMRLHLLQGILAFHTLNKDKAKVLLTRAEDELKLLTVDEVAMMQVMSMGFTQPEARLGLRVCEGNVQLAVAHIMKRREEKAELKRKESEEKREKRIQRKLGKTAAGSWVHVSTYDQLVAMGFPKGASAEALRQSNNDITQSIQILQDHPELLSLPDPEKNKVQITDDMMTQVLSLGFDFEAARAALSMFQGDVQQAVEELLKVAGVAPQTWRDAAEASSSSSSSTSPTSPEPGGSKPADPKKKQEEDEAIQEIVPDLDLGEDAHLDLTLDEEAQFLQEYRAMLDSL